MFGYAQRVFLCVPVIQYLWAYMVQCCVVAVVVVVVVVVVLVVVVIVDVVFVVFVLNVDVVVLATSMVDLKLLVMEVEFGWGGVGGVQSHFRVNPNTVELN